MSESPSSSPSAKHFSVPPDPSRGRLGRNEASPLFSALGSAPYTSAALGGCIIGDGGVAVVRDQLRKLASRHSLVELSVANCTATLPENEANRTIAGIASAASNCSELVALDLSDNVLGSKGLSACALLFSKLGASLRVLKLCRTALGPDAARLLRSFLGSQGEFALRVLHIDDNALSSGGVFHITHIIEKCPQLEELSMSSLGAGSDAIGRVLRALSSLPNGSLRSLNLSGNECDVGCALGFVSLLNAHPELRRLVLSNMNIVDDAAYSVLRAATKSAVGLEYLSLAGNALTKASGDAVRAWLQAKGSSLKELDLSQNSLGNECVLRIVGAVKPKTTAQLEKLSLSSVEASDLAVASTGLAVSSLQNFLSLDLKGNRIAPHVVEKLREALDDKVLVSSDEGGSERPRVPTGETETSSELAKVLEKLGNPMATKLPTSQSETVVTSADAGSDTAGSSSSSSFFSRMFGSREEESLAIGGKDESNVDSDGNAVVEASARLQSSRARQERQEGVIGSPGSEFGLRTPRTRESSIGATTPDSTRRSASVVSSARQLRAQVVSLDREVNSLVEELKFSGPRNGVRQSPAGDIGLGVSDLPPISSGPAQKSLSAEMADIFWACVLAIFLLVLILGIVQGLDEVTFSSRPV